MLPEGIDGNALVRHAYDRYDLSLGVGLSKVAGKLFRIGHLGALSELMTLSVLAGAEMAMRDFDIAIVPGSGVGAAGEYYRATSRRLDEPVELAAVS